MGGMRRRTVASGLLAGMVMLSGCGEAAGPEQRIADVERKTVALADHPEAVAALRESSYRLGAAMLATDPEANQVTSPVSALTALALLRVGAGSTTAEELDEVLGFPLEHRDEAMNALLKVWEEHDGDPGTVDDDEPPGIPMLHLANGLFPAEDLPLGDGFMNSLAEHYGAGVYPVDYAGSDALGAMNAWVNQHTGGRIEEAPIEPTPDTLLNLINTVYFAAAWAEPFEPESTEPGIFTSPTGGVQAELMHTVQQVRYAEGEGWRGIDLPYNDGFVMRLILPEEGKSPILEEGVFAEANDALDATPDAFVGVTLPKWDHAFDIDLVDVLTSMGLVEAMGPSPDYSGLSGTELFVEGAAQSANITVAEKGTVAAAVTQVSMAESGFSEPDFEITFNRPFLYQILHEETGIPVFLGTVMDPNPAG